MYLYAPVCAGNELYWLLDISSLSTIRPTTTYSMPNLDEFVSLWLAMLLVRVPNCCSLSLMTSVLVHWSVLSSVPNHCCMYCPCHTYLFFLSIYPIERILGYIQLQRGGGVPPLNLWPFLCSQGYPPLLTLHKRGKGRPFPPPWPWRPGKIKCRPGKHFWGKCRPGRHF